MKKLYRFDCCSIDGDVFVNGNAEYIGHINGNDGSYREEHMSFIPNFFTGKIIDIDFDFPEEIEVWDEEVLLNSVEQYQDQILRAIKAT